MSDDWQEAEGEGTGHHYSYLPAPSSQDPVQLLLILSTTILQDLIPVKMDIADQKLMDQGGGAQLSGGIFHSASKPRSSRGQAKACTAVRYPRTPSSISRSVGSSGLAQTECCRHLRHFF